MPGAPILVTPIGQKVVSPIYWAKSVAARKDLSWDKKNLAENLILALAALTSWEEKVVGIPYRRAWQSYDFGALDSLVEKGFVSFSYKAKSMHLTDEGYELGIELAKTFSQAADAAEQKSPDGFQQAETMEEADFPTFADVENDLYAIYARVLAKSAITRARLDPVPLEARPQFNPKENRKSPDNRAFRILVDLDLEGLRPCWREILMPAACTFLDLHIVIQRVFNWYDAHLFNFNTKSRGTNLRIDEDSFMDMDVDLYVPKDIALVEAVSVQLGDIFGRTKTAKYSYDYGDGWEHKVKVVEVIADSGVVAPQLLDGEGDAPPEDVGGPGGFESFLKVIADPNNPDHDWMMEWGESQMWTPFDLRVKQKELEETFEEDQRRWHRRIEEREEGCL